MIKFQHATNRNTKAYEVRIGTMRVYVSYDTVVAASYHDCQTGEFTKARRECISRTTNRHLREMGIYGWPETDEAGIEAIIRKGLIERTPRGRRATPTAFEYLGLSAPVGYARQMSLLEGAE